MLNVFKQNYSVTQKLREEKNGYKSAVVWFTGLSGSGKSTVANAVELLLFQQGKNVFTLDGDNMRLGLNAGLGFTEQDRSENLRRIAEVSKLMTEAGLIVFCAFVSPLLADREMVKSIVGEQNFIEVFIKTSLEECERRDVKGLYKKARSGEISHFTGISAPYEIPTKPDIVIETELSTIEESANYVAAFIKDKIK
jgi:adenylylsulfate kinase